MEKKLNPGHILISLSILAGSIINAVMVSSVLREWLDEIVRVLGILTIKG